MADVSLLFEVLGGDSTSKGSGLLIKNQLEGIINNINKTPLKLKIEVDKNSLKTIESQVKAIMSATGSANAGIMGAGGAGSKTSAAKATSDYKEAAKAIRDYYAVMRSLPKSHHDLFKIPGSEEFKSITGRSKELEAQVNDLRDAFDKATASMGNMTSEEYSKTIALIASEVLKLDRALEDVSNKKIDSSLFSSSMSTIKGYYDAMGRAAKLNPSVAPQYDKSTGVYTSTQEYQTLANTLTTTRKAFEGLGDVMINLPFQDQLRLLEALTREEQKYNLVLEEQKNKRADAAKVAADKEAERQATEAARQEQERQNKVYSDAIRTLREMAALGAKKIRLEGVGGKEALKEAPLLESEIQSATLRFRDFADEVKKLPVEKQDEFNRAIRETVQKLKILEEEQKRASSARGAKEAVSLEKQKAAATQAYLNILNNLQKTLRNYSSAETSKNQGSREAYSAMREQAEVIRGYKQQLDSGTISVDDFGRKVNEAREVLKSSRIDIEANGDATRTLGARVKDLASKFTAWLSITRVIMAARRVLQNMVRDVAALDTAMTELRKVTDETNAVYDKFLLGAADRAKEFGATIQETINATADFARLGYSIEDASDLADVAIVYKNVGDGIQDIEEASESIISTLKAFRLEASDAMGVVDKFNEVGNNFAISSKGVGEALLNSAAAMASANNSLDETIALITAANTVVQNPKRVGTALRTVSMFIRSAKVELEELGESAEGMASSTSKLRDSILGLTGGVVDIQLDENTYKNTYQILKEISEVWEGIHDIERASLLEMLGGKRNANVVAAILSDFSIAEESLATSLNSAGSALKENEKVLASIEGRIKKFKASFEDLSMTLFSTDLIKSTVDMGTGLLKVVKVIVSLTNKVGGLKTILFALGATIAFLKIDAVIGRLTRVTAVLRDSLGIFPSIIKFITHAGAASTQGSSRLQSLSAGFNAIGISASTAQVAVLGFAAAIGIIIAAYSLWKKHQEKLMDAYREQISQADEIKDSYYEIREAYSDLMVARALNLSTAGTEGELTAAVDKVVVALGKKAEVLETLTRGTQAYRHAVTEAARAEIEESERVAKQATHAAGQILKKTAGSSLAPTVAATEAERLREPLSGLAEGGLVGKSVWRFSSPEEIASQYMILSNAADRLTDSNETNSKTYEKVVSSMSKLKEASEEYIKAMLLEEEISYSVRHGTPVTDREKINYYEHIAKVMKTAFGIEKEGLAKYAIEFPVAKEALLAVASAGRVTAVDLSELSTVMSNLRDRMDVLTKAREEMATGKGLSAETIEAVIDSTEDYIDYLYEENGVIKLNIEAWTDYATEKARQDISSIEAEIEEGKKLNDEIRERIRLLHESKAAGKYEEGTEGYSEYREEITSLNRELEENTRIIENNQLKLSLYKDLYEKAGGAADGYRGILENFSQISDFITSLSDSLTTVADLQEAVGESFTMSIEKALEFAEVYPEILNKAVATADGQINLNRDVVNSFIEGRDAERKALIDTEIDKLEAKREVLTAEMNFARAKLAIVKSVGEGEGKITRDVAVYKVEAANKVAEALVGNAKSEAHAYMLAAAAMSGNMEEFERVARIVATDVDGNLNEAAYNAALGIYNNMNTAKIDISAVAKQAHETAKAMQGMAAGEVRGKSTIVSGSSGAKRQAMMEARYHGADFKELMFDYEAVTMDLEDFSTELELDIKEYEESIANLDGQIAILRAMRNQKLPEFSTSAKQASKSGSKADKKEKEGPKGPTWFEEQYKLHKHLLAMDAESMEDYLSWLNTAYKQAYAENIITLDDYYKYQEEVYKGLQDLFKNHLSNIEHEISMRKGFKSESKKVLSMYKGLIKDVEKEIAAARAKGLNDNDKYIQELQSKWASYNKEIESMEKEATDNAKRAVDNLVKIRIDMLKQDIKSQKDALNKKLKDLREFYDKQKQMLQDAYDEDKYLEEQTEKRKKVTDVQVELDRLEYDNSAWAQKRKLELAQEMTDVQKDLASFEKDHALKEAQDKLDEMYRMQEESLEKQNELLDEKSNDAKALYDQALKDIKTGSVTLYKEMIEWNNVYGDGIKETITDAWEEAYEALDNYNTLFGKHYEGVKLANATGYVKPKDSWDSSTVSGGGTTKTTAPATSTSSTSSSSKTTTATTSGPSKTTTTSTPKSSAPSLSKGSSVTVKSSATHFSAKSKNVKMASFVPGGKYTVYQTSGNEVLIGRGGVYTGWIKKSDIVGYAKGTRSALAGLHSIDELGMETIFQSKDGTRYKMFTGGEKVLNAKASNFLYDFAVSGGETLKNMVKSALGGGIASNITPVVVNNNVSMGDIIINGSTDKSTVSEIRREQRSALQRVLQGLNKLNK